MTGETYVIRVRSSDDFYVGRSENAGQVFAEVVQLFQPQPGNEMIFVYREQLSDSEHKGAVEKLTGYKIERQELQEFCKTSIGSHVFVQMSGQIEGRSKDPQVAEIVSDLNKLSLTKQAEQPSSEDGAVAQKRKVPDSLASPHKSSSSSQSGHTYVFQLVGTDYFRVGRSENPKAQLAKFEAVSGKKALLVCHTRLSDSEHEETVQELTSSNPQRRTLQKGKHIYLIHEAETTYYKVGHSEDPTKRRRELQTGNPRELTY